MGVGFWMLYIMAILLTMALLAVMIWYATDPQKTTVGPVPPIFTNDITAANGMQQAYVQGNGQFELSAAKPFVVTVPRKFNTKSCFVFSDISLQNNLQASSHGFSFIVNKPITVMALQVIDELFTAGTREVAIYNLTTRTLLFRASVDKVSDGLDGAFRSHPLLFSQQFLLAPNVVYACVGQVQTSDRIATPDEPYCLPTNDVAITGIGSVVTSVLTLPSNFTSTPINNSPFASFQYQIVPTGAEIAFTVDSKLALMPPNFIGGFNFSVSNDGTTLTLDPGACASVYAQHNLISDSTQSWSTQDQKLDPDTWYAVFVANPDIAVDPNAAEIVLSRNYPEITDRTQFKLNKVRRIGFVRTKADPTRFVQVTQTGPETRRTYTFAQPNETNISLNIGNNTTITLPLTLVAPTANTCTMQVQLQFVDAAFLAQIPAVTLHFNTSHKLVFGARQTYQLLTSSLFLNTSIIPQNFTVSVSYDDTSYTGPTPLFVFTILDFTTDI